jgi:hypothetical protein
MTPSFELKMVDRTLLVEFSRDDFLRDIDAQQLERAVAYARTLIMTGGSPFATEETFHRVKTEITRILAQEIDRGDLVKREDSLWWYPWIGVR